MDIMHLVYLDEPHFRLFLLSIASGFYNYIQNKATLLTVDAQLQCFVDCRLFNLEFSHPGNQPDPRVQPFMEMNDDYDRSFLDAVP